jgi:hypothetical protein
LIWGDVCYVATFDVCLYLLVFDALLTFDLSHVTCHVSVGMTSCQTTYTPGQRLPLLLLLLLLLANKLMCCILCL